MPHIPARRAGACLLGLFAGGAALLVSATPASSAVTAATEAELRAAIADVAEDVITLEADITITSCEDTGTDEDWGDLDRVDGAPLVIEGAGHTLTQSCAGESVLEFEGTNDVTINDLTITGGNKTGLGGGIYFRDGTLDVNDSTLVDNQATGSGGAINGDFADIRIEGSTISGNSANNTGGVYSNGLIVLINSTVTGNTSNNNTGGVAGADFILLAHATVVGNSGPGGANVSLDGEGADLRIAASVIASPLGGGTNCELAAPTLSSGYSFSDDDSCDLSGTGDVENGGDPMLGALADNGGPTLTMHPEPDSALIDLVALAFCDPGGLAEDQRDAPRPVGAGCDAGAVEVQPADVTEPPDAPAAEPVVAQPTLTG